MLPIRQTMESFLNLIANKEEGGPFSRFKSWEYCHRFFVESRQKHLTDEDIDILALHLSFYLASWGMYRGSSFLLQRDYKTHRNIVRIVFKDKYNELWDFDPRGKDSDELDHIASLADEAYREINDCGYGEILERAILDDGNDEDNIDERNISYTLITKILMGTFAITPAFDRFFIDGLKKYNKANNTKGSSYCKERLVKLFEFVQSNGDDLNVVDGQTAFPYPMMKKADMYFWEVGYESGFIEPLENLEKYLNDKRINNITDSKKKRVYNKLISQVGSVIPSVLTLNSTHLENISQIIELIKRRVC